MGEKEKKDGARMIMVNSDEDIIEALKEINETLKVKEKKTIVIQESTNIRTLKKIKQR